MKSEPEILLSVHQLSKRYASNDRVIENLSHNFLAGTATALVGPNGSGKTTFLRLISAAAFPTSGSVSFRGMDIHRNVHAYLKHVGLVSDSSDLPAFLTARELVEFMLHRKNFPPNEIPELCIEVLDAVELDERRNTLIGTYSSGMLQKTMIAAALAGNPEILLLDEPFRALDESATRAVMEILKKYLAGGGTILISSHQDAVLQELCEDTIRFPV